jgi:steroid 5-alpha reductase family enzyme
LFQRVLREGKDSRFDEIKKSPGRFFAAFMAQATWVSLCIMPLMALNAVPTTAFAMLPSAVRLTDVLGLALFAGGFGFEVVADRQKDRWVRQKKAKEHDEEFMTRGLWGRSQFPNYFGEMTLWVGIATLTAGVLVTSPAQGALGLGGSLLTRVGTTSMAFVAPAFTSFVLLKVSGVPLSEKKYDKRYGQRKDYQEWKRNTPKIFPKIL